MSLVVLVNVASTLFMAGMIWTVQVVHYPLFALVGEGSFVSYEAAHTRRIGALLALPWAAEGLSSLWLVIAPPPGVPGWLAVAGLAAAAIPVLVTVGDSVGLHGVLADGFDRRAHRRLVAGNWVRTVAWTAHAGIALALLAAVV